MAHEIPALKVLSETEALQNLKRHKHLSRNYAAMYSSWLGGITTDPNLMMVPIDDHGFHRGDAVFEAMKCAGGKIYTLDRHLDRMRVSASKIGLELPPGLREIAIETTRASGLDTCLLRYYVSRGPGGFTTNPYESVGAQTYLVITPFTPPTEAKYQAGVSAKTSQYQVKEGFFATVKSCNYLPNVMMKKEAVDSKLDFTVSLDEEGFIAEGSTENFAILTSDDTLLVPGFERTLRGITLTRAMELASEDPELRKRIRTVAHGKFKPSEVLKAKEAFFFGTTLDCIGVREFDGQAIGVGESSGRSGPVAQAFYRALQTDIVSGPLSVSLR